MAFNILFCWKRVQCLPIFLCWGYSGKVWFPSSMHILLIEIVFHLPDGYLLDLSLLAGILMGFLCLILPLHPVLQWRCLTCCVLFFLSDKMEVSLCYKCFFSPSPTWCLLWKWGFARTVFTCTTEKSDGSEAYGHWLFFWDTSSSAVLGSCPCSPDTISSLDCLLQFEVKCTWAAQLLLRLFFFFLTRKRVSH